MKKDSNDGDDVIRHQEDSGADTPTNQDTRNDSSQRGDAALDTNNEADRTITGLLRVIGWQSNRDRELSEEDADLLLEIAATQPVSEEERRRLQEGVLRRRFGTTAVPAQRPDGDSVVAGDEAHRTTGAPIIDRGVTSRDQPEVAQPATERSLLGLLKEESGLALDAIAKGLDIESAFLVDLSEHPSLVPNGARQEIARRAKTAWDVSAATTLATFESRTAVAMQKAASRKSAFKTSSTTYKDIVSRSKLSAEQKRLWLSLI